MPLDALRRLFRSKGSKKDKADSPKPRHALIDDKGGMEKLEPHEEEVAAEITSKPLSVRNKSASDVAKMVRNPIGRDGGLTDSEMRGVADRLEQIRGKKYVRTGAGAPILTGSGDVLQFGSDDPQPMHGMKKGGKVKSRGSASGASKRGDGIAKRGKTKGRFV